MTPSDDPKYVTALLDRIQEGDRAASNELWPLVYDELKALSSSVFAGQAKNQTLQATALVHEAYMKLVGGSGAHRGINGRRHFLALATRAMRLVLIDRARGRLSQKRGGNALRVTLSEADLDTGQPTYDLVDLGEALEELHRSHERIAQVVELRFLGGLTVEEVAQELDVSERTVKKDWRAGRAWLSKRLAAE